MCCYTAVASLRYNQHASRCNTTNPNLCVQPERVQSAQAAATALKVSRPHVEVLESCHAWPHGGAAAWESAMAAGGRVRHHARRHYSVNVTFACGLCACAPVSVYLFCIINDKPFIWLAHWKKSEERAHLPHTAHSTFYYMYMRQDSFYKRSFWKRMWSFTVNCPGKLHGGAIWFKENLPTSELTLNHAVVLAFPAY